ncbi:redox-sensing transcriptional repressor Rex [Cellulomonas sp. PhB143]|uniref:redox-sensing transcriptional repressor Rex n=1 Tax=Cellulomonas sp. PhB143 TaxID=2485186 RepID=UPI000F4A6D63|nr:redox-sensing transcriptional repressor Rex [Cellulomonas sp. PhB143]ROS76682.1 redox-sensing transcriptional repressor [Cellulomonas sp. PhB143]
MDRDDATTGPDVPPATVGRLPRYLRALHGLLERGVPTTSSAELAGLAGVGSAQLRKDLSFLGSFGTRGVGYDVEALIGFITATLGIESVHRVVIVGIGDLGHALANYTGYTRRGFEVVGLFDTSPTVIGTTVAGDVVRDVAELAGVVAGESVSMAILAVPRDAAQAAADAVVAAGVTGILSFAPLTLQVPEHVDVRGIDVASELQILAFHAQARAGLPAAGTVAPAI